MGTNGRELTLTLEAKVGAINLFYAFLNGEKVISGLGTQKQEWKGTIPDGEVNLKIRAIGIDDAQYSANIDLPGTAKDQKLTFSLAVGYHEFEITL